MVKTIEYGLVTIIVGLAFWLIIWLCVSGVGKKIDIWGNDELVIEDDYGAEDGDDYYEYGNDVYNGVDDDNDNEE